MYVGEDKSWDEVKVRGKDDPCKPYKMKAVRANDGSSFISSRWAWHLWDEGMINKESAVRHGKTSGMIVKCVPKMNKMKMPAFIKKNTKTKMENEITAKAHQIGIYSIFEV